MGRDNYAYQVVDRGSQRVLDLRLSSDGPQSRTRLTPAREFVQRPLGRWAGFGRVDQDRETGVGEKLERLERKGLISSALGSGTPIRDGRARCIKVCLCLIDLSLERRRIDSCDEFAISDSGVEVREQRLDRSRYLRPDLNGHHSIWVTRCGDCNVHVAML